MTEVKASFEKLFKSNNSILAKQRARALEIAKLEKVQADLKIKLTNLNALSESSDISEKLKSQEEAIAAFDAYRKQVNRTLLELEEKLDELQLKIQDSQ